MLPYSTTLFGTPPSPVAPLGPTPPPARPWYRSPPSVEPLPAGCSCSICQRETSAFGSSSYTRSSPATSASLAASPQPPSEPPHDYDACDCSVCTRMRDLKGVPETGLKKVKSRVKRLLGRMGVRSRTRREAAAEDLEDEQPPISAPVVDARRDLPLERERASESIARRPGDDFFLPIPPSSTISRPDTPRPHLLPCSWEPPETRECAICCSDLPLADFKPVTATCTHRADICPADLIRHVETAIEHSRSAPVSCPSGGCDAVLSHDEVRKIASADAFERYDGWLVRIWTQRTARFCWCQAVGCGAGQEHLGGEDEPIMTCAACGRKTCFSHQRPWHAGRTCKEYDKHLRRTNKSEAATIAFMKKTARRKKMKPCPNCSARILKSAGCDHMACAPPGGCGFDFCWACLADHKLIWEEGNHRHKRSCTHWRRQ